MNIEDRYSEGAIKAGAALWATWNASGRRIAEPFDLMDKFERIRWIETAKARAPLLVNVRITTDETGKYLRSTVHHEAGVSVSVQVEPVLKLEPPK